MHLPVGCKKSGDVVIGKKVGRSMWPHQHADVPVCGVAGFERVKRFCIQRRQAERRCHMQHITCPQRAATVATKLTQREGRAAAQIVGYIHAAIDGQVGAATGPQQFADAQGLPRQHVQRCPQGNRLAVQRGFHGRAGQRDGLRAAKTQRWPGYRDFQRSLTDRVAHQAVGCAQRQAVHRAGRWHPHIPETKAARPVLHGGVNAPGQHVKSPAGRVKRQQAAGGVCSADERGEVHHSAQIVQVGLQPGDAGVGQRLGQFGQRLLAVITQGNQFSQHGVVPGADLGAALDPGVHAQVGGKHHVGQHAGRRLKALEWVFGIQTRLNGVAALRNRQRLQWRQITCSQLEHPFNNVHTGYRFGDAVLYLQAGIDLQKIEVLRGCIDHKFNRARRAVGNGLGQASGGGVQGLAHFFAQIWCRGFFDHLLVAALQGTITLAEYQHPTLAVTKHLHLNVPRVQDVALDKHTGLGKIGLRQPSNRFERA